MINLPKDVLIDEILLKLDTKTLGKLRCVCRYLQSFISSPAFVKMHSHYQFNNNPLIFLVSANKSVFYSLNFNGTHIKPYCPRAFRTWNPVFFCSCNGLLFLADKESPSNYLWNSTTEEFLQSPSNLWNPTTKEYNELPPRKEYKELPRSPSNLWNPTTKEYKELPPPLSPRLSSTETSFFSHPNIISGGCTSFVAAYGLGYDSIINDYKVIQCRYSMYYRFFPRDGPSHITKNYTIIEFQVYTLGTDTWRRINDNPYISYCTTPYHSKTPGMFVNGALHWILRETEFSGSKIITAFDIEKEMFRAEVPKPHSNLSDCSSNWSLHVLKGCLCIYERFHQREALCVDIWMMNDYGVIESWTKLFTVKMFGATATCGLKFKVLNFCKNGEVIIARDYKHPQDLILYNPINENSQKLNGEIPDGISYTEIHIESLVSLNTRIYRYGMAENKQAMFGKELIEGK